MGKIYLLEEVNLTRCIPITLRLNRNHFFFTVKTFISVEDLGIKSIHFFYPNDVSPHESGNLSS